MSECGGERRGSGVSDRDCSIVFLICEEQTGLPYHNDRGEPIGDSRQQPPKWTVLCFSQAENTRLRQWGGKESATAYLYKYFTTKVEVADVHKKYCSGEDIGPVCVNPTKKILVYNVNNISCSSCSCLWWFTLF